MPRSTPCTRARPPSKGLDFFFRKMVRDQFQAVTRLASDITETVKGDTGGGELLAERELLGTALEDVQGTIGAMGGWLMKSQENTQEMYRVGLNTTRLLMMVGDLVIGWLLLRQAEVAIEALAAEGLSEGSHLLQGQGHHGEVVRSEQAAAALSRGR